jgi:hypothetical protein
MRAFKAAAGVRHDCGAACPVDIARFASNRRHRLAGLEVTEAVLNHISGSRGGIAGVYQRHDWAAEKRTALDAWAAHVLAIAEQGTPASNVVKLTRAT